MAYFGLQLLDHLYHQRPRLDANWQQDLRSVVPSVVDTGSALIDRTNVFTVRKSAMLESGAAPTPLAWLHR